MLAARELTKEYQSGSSRLAVLRDVSFDVDQGAFVAIVGPSGSGKTTLLGLLAGLDTPTGGTVLLDGADLTRLDEDARADRIVAALNQVLEAGVTLTPDLGGTATTTAFTDAICAALAA